MFAGASIDSKAQLLENSSNSIGINATGFVGNYLSFGGSVVSTNPYWITYNRRIGPGSIRFGMNIQITREDDNRFQGSPIDRESSNVDLRLGYAWSKKISKRFDFIYGADLIYGDELMHQRNVQQIWDGTKMNKFHNVSVNNMQTYGAGVIGGIQFQINDKIALYTEGSLYARYQEMQQGVKWEGVSDELRLRFPNAFDNRVFDSFNKDLMVTLPVDIYLTFNF